MRLAVAIRSISTAAERLAADKSKLEQTIKIDQPHFSIGSGECSMIVP